MICEYLYIYIHVYKYTCKYKHVNIHVNIHYSVIIVGIIKLQTGREVMKIQISLQIERWGRNDSSNMFKPRNGSVEPIWFFFQASPSTFLWPKLLTYVATLTNGIFISTGYSLSTYSISSNRSSQNLRLCIQSLSSGWITHRQICSSCLARGGRKVNSGKKYSHCSPPNILLAEIIFDHVDLSF